MSFGGVLATLDLIVDLLMMLWVALILMVGYVIIMQKRKENEEIGGGWVSVRKKPVVVKAFQFTQELYDFYKNHETFTLNDVPFKTVIKKREKVIRVDTLEGEHNVRPNAWIIMGIKNEVYPCDDWVFRETYEVL
jgi:hypothetical protein